MPSSVTQPFYDGETLSLPELVQRTARITFPMVAYERDVPLDQPLPDRLEREERFDEKEFRESAVELATVILWTDEEADAQAHQANMRVFKSQLEIRRDNRAKRKIYAYMTAQVAAWEAPTAEHEPLRTAMQSQLDDTFANSLDTTWEGPSQRLTGAEYRQKRMERLAESIAHANERMDSHNLVYEQDSEWVAVLKESVENWEPVEVPRRVLP